MLSNENVYSLSSPSSLLVFEKSIVLLSILGGVPVLSLSILNPNFSRFSLKYKEGLVPFGPETVLLSPTNIFAFI